MNQYETIEEIETAITSDLQRIDVHLASIVSVVTGIHRATQQYTQAIRSASQHLQTWTQFFAGYRPAKSNVALTETNSNTTEMVSENPNQEDLDEKYPKENQRPQVASPETMPLESEHQINKSQKTQHLTPQFTSPLTSSKSNPAAALPLGLTPDLKSPLLTVKEAAAAQPTPKIELNSKKPDLRSPVWDQKLTNLCPDQVLLTPDFSSPPFSHKMASIQPNGGDEQVGCNATIKSSFDLDLSFISSVAADSPKRLSCDPLPELVDESDSQHSISFSVPSSTRKLADISALINQDPSDSFSLQSNEEENFFKDSLQTDRSSASLDFSKLPSIYRSGYAQKQIMDIFECLKSSTSPLSLQTLVQKLDQSEGMMNLMIDTLHQRGFIRPVFENGERKWVIM